MSADKQAVRQLGLQARGPSSGWCVRLYRYDGSTSVITVCETENEARAQAEQMNKAYMSDGYRVEKWKAGGGGR